MILQLTGGRILHTAYSNNNLGDPEGFSLDSQDGATYKGTYIDESTTESTNPEDYSWEELYNPDIDDTDDAGNYGTLTNEAELAALQSQITALQTRSQEMAEAITENQNNTSSAAGAAGQAQAIAEATGQHFWDDDSGAHVTEVTKEEFNDPESSSYQSGANTIWNTRGQLFRNGLNNLLAIIAALNPGEETGVLIYDGEGNNPENVVASFTDKGSQIGKENEAHSLIDKQSMRVIGANEDNDVTPVSYIGLLNGRATGQASIIEYPTIKVSSGADLSSVRVDLLHAVNGVSFCQTLILNEQVDLLSRTSFTDGDSFITLNLSGIGVATDTPYMLFINYLTADLIPCYSFSNRDVSMVGSLNSGAYSMMIGQDVSASGYGAFAQGWNSYASVPYAFASGVDNDVNGEGATARGRCLKIQNKGGTDQTVIGHYNSPVEDKAFVIGNGTADDSRSNAFEVDWNGNVLASGDVTDGDGNVLSDKISRSDLFFKPGDVYSVTYNHARALTGYISSSTKGMYFEIPLPKFLTNVNGANITAMAGGVRGIGGYVDGLTNNSNLLSGYTVTASVDNPNTLYVSIVKSSALSNATNNTPISVALNSINISFT